MPFTAASIPQPPAAVPRSSVVPLAGRWEVRLLGGLEARNGEMVVSHFVSQPIAALFARLVLWPQRSHPREELIELLWPGVALAVGRNRLRNAMSSLRRLLEPPGVVAGSVLVADRQTLQLAPGASHCDAIDFERAVRAGQGDRARALYRGELLPGFYDEWVHDERARLAALYERIADSGDDKVIGDPPASAVSPPDPWPMAAPALPAYLTGFFGRDAERAQLHSLIASRRLVTLCGAGGCGKTRLAVEVARAAQFACIAFVALADCSDAAQLTAQLRVALQSPRAAGDPLDQVIAMLRDQTSLLVLDNFEQLVQSGGVPIVEALLARVPTLTVLVTSRRVLGLPGEHELSLQPLPQPEPGGSLEQVAASPSVSLFVDRARGVRPDFQVTPRNCGALAALCGALEGLPLAIELAASRSRAFSPADMHAALAQRFTLLARGHASRAGKPAARHDSLRAAIDWSWQLLQPGTQRFLVALSVFRGGWSAVSAQDVSDVPEAHGLLEMLTADSLLRSEVDATGAMRFFMLEMIREYLHEQLAAAEAQLLRRRHRAHFLARGMALGQRMQAAPREELPNFVEAMQTAVDDGEPRLALALGVALRGEWDQHGMTAQVQGLMQRALRQQADAAGATPLLVQAHLVLRAALLVAGESDAAQVHATEALALAGSQPAPRAAALLGQALQHWERSRDHEAMRPLLSEALVLARQVHAVETEAGVLAALGKIAFDVDDLADEGIRLLSEAQQLYESAGIEAFALRMLFMKATCHAKRFDFESALPLLAECERRFTASGHASALTELANVQGFLFAYMVRWRDAELAFARCTLSAAKQQNRYMMCLGLWNMARPLAHCRQPEAAGLLMAFSVRFWEANFAGLVASDRRYVEQIRRLIRVQIGAAAMARLWARAEHMTLAEALGIAARSLLDAPASA